MRTAWCSARASFLLAFLTLTQSCLPATIWLLRRLAGAWLSHVSGAFSHALSIMMSSYMATLGTVMRPWWLCTLADGQRSHFLLKADIPVLSKSLCDRRITKVPPLRSRYPAGSGHGVICGFSSERKDACQVSEPHLYSRNDLLPRVRRYVSSQCIIKSIYEVDDHKSSEGKRLCCTVLHGGTHAAI